MVELEVGPVAHGGHCVARLEGRVVFVRHALPGEQVRARLTEAAQGARLWRADAVEVLRASPDRVAPACPVAGPAGCGGCDFQHVSPAGQRRLKTAVLREQMQRLASLDVDVEVEEVPAPAGSPDPPGAGLGWRTRVTFAADESGRLGFRAHREHRVVPVGSCPIASPSITDLGLPQRRWPGWSAVEAVAPAGTDERLVVAVPGPGGGPQSPPRLDPGVSLAVAAPEGGPGRSAGPPAPLRRLAGRTWVREGGVDERGFRVTGGGFWQVHPAAAPVLRAAVLAGLQARPGERALDLYSGAGLLTATLAEAVGPAGRVTSVEGDERAVGDARRNLHDLPQVELVHGRVDRALRAGDVAPQVDLVVLDPPRSGAGREVVGHVAGRSPRVVVYVACDPAALARDVATFAGHGYVLAGLRAFDLFPQTHHLESVAVLRPARA